MQYSIEGRFCSRQTLRSMEVNNSACDYANDALLRNLIRPLFVEILLKIRLKYSLLPLRLKIFQNLKSRILKV